VYADTLETEAPNAYMLRPFQDQLLSNLGEFIINHDALRIQILSSRLALQKLQARAVNHTPSDNKMHKPQWDSSVEMNKMDNNFVTKFGMNRQRFVLNTRDYLAFNLANSTSET